MTRRLITLLILIGCTLSSVVADDAQQSGLDAVLEQYGPNIWTLIILQPREERPLWFRRYTEEYGCVKADNCWFNV